MHKDEAAPPRADAIYRREQLFRRGLLRGVTLIPLTSSSAIVMAGCGGGRETQHAMVSQGHLDKVRCYIELGPKRGATLLCGGLDVPMVPDRVKKGNHVMPAMFADVDNRMKISQEENFGPVACLIPFEDEADTICVANDIAYGLCRYVWIENLGRAHRVAAAPEAGMCIVNSRKLRDVRQPFGRAKASGTNRECGTWSYEVFLEPKNIWVFLGSHHIPHWGI